MPLTAAEKQRHYRERKKAQIGEKTWKQQDAERKRIGRATNLEETREKERAKIRRWRALKKKEADSEQVSKTTQPYSNPSSLSRAVKRARSGLPSSPRKCCKVLNTLFKQHNISFENDIDQRPSTSHNKVPEDIEKHIHQFYLRNDISWMAPGRKDCISVVREGVKVHEQRRYLMMSIAEAYNLYREEYPDDTVGLTKFKALRPDVVLCKDKMPHNVCVCQYHENINALLRSMKKVSDIPGTHKELLPLVVCDVTNEDCMYGNCINCKESVLLQGICAKLSAIQLGENIKWMEWIRSVEGQSVKTQRSGTLQDTLLTLEEKLPGFKIHSFIKNKQAAAFHQMHKTPKPMQAVLQLDFSENATIIEQDEVQSAHWTHKQVTIFTAVAWTNENTSSYVAVSDNLSHDKYCAASMLEIIIDQVQEKQTIPLQQFDIFSDGAAQHFKQKYMFAFITSLLENKKIHINWHFFATSHGKGAVDGIGGTVKRAVHNAIMTRRYHVKTAEEYAVCARASTNQVNVIYVPSSQITAKQPDLDVIWLSVKAVPNTQSVHCVRTEGFGRVTVSQYTGQVGKEHSLFHQPMTSSTKAIQSAGENQPPLVRSSDIKPGCYVAIPMDTQKGRSFLYIASVSSIQNDRVTVKFLRKIGKEGLYRDAETEDSSEEPVENISFICPEPQINMIGTRMRYSFKFTSVQRDIMDKYASL